MIIVGKIEHKTLPLTPRFCVHLSPFVEVLDRGTRKLFATNIMEDKHHISLGYDYVVKALELPEGHNICHFDLTADNYLIRGVFDRSIVMLDAVLMWLCHKGSCVAIVGGITHTVDAGQMLIVFAGTHCRFHSVSADFEASTLLLRIPSNAAYNSLAKSFPRIKFLPVLTLSEQEFDLLSALFNYAKLSVAKPHHSHRSEVDVSIQSLLHDELADLFLHRNYEIKESSADEQLVKRFEIMLSKSSFEHRDVDYFASQFNIPSKKFAQKIRRITGVNPSVMISAAVIKNAKRLLSSTELSSSEIAERLHFATPSFFCRYFRRYTGLTPSEWRMENVE